jgi:glycosyltransferase involved in cell wall biosynthesis
MQPPRKKMKIAHLIPQFYPHIGGAEVCIHNVCRTLSESGHEAVVVTTSCPPQNPPELSYQIEYLWDKTCGMFRKLPYFLGSAYLHHSLKRLQEKHSFDLWQVTNGWPLGAFAVDFFRKNNIPCVLRCCGEDIQKFPEINYGVRLDKKIDVIIRKKFPLFDAFVALTPTVKEEYIQIGVSEEKIRMIPNGADTIKFRHSKENGMDMLDIREKYDVGEGKLILTTGRYHPKKGFDLIPEIARLLKSENLNFKWIVAGPLVSQIPKKFPECERLGVICSEEFAKSDRTSFNLPPSGLVNLYCASDIYVLPTLLETFGMVLVEAMAAGLPIVTTDAPGVKDVIRDGYDGIKVPAGSAISIAEAVKKIMFDSELCKSLSRNAILTAEEEYEWENVVAKYLSLYEDTFNTFKHLK